MNHLRLAGILCFAACSVAEAKRVEELTLVEIQQALAGKRFVDLTHAFAPGNSSLAGFSG